MEWLPHPLQTHTRWLPTFICCGWEYGSMIMPFLPHLLAQICEVSWDLCHWWCAHKWWYGTVVEALHPHGMAPISTQTHKMWLTTFICCGWVYGSVIVPLSSHLLAQIWEVSLQMMPRWLVEALNPHGMVPTSTPNIYKVIDNLQMLRIVIWICHMPLLPHTCWFRLGKCQLRSASLVVCTQMMTWHSDWGSKATWNGSHVNSNTYNMIDNLYMLWNGVWIRYRAIITTLAGPDLGSHPPN